MVSCAACGRAESDSARFIGDKCVSKSSPLSSRTPGGKTDARAVPMATGTTVVYHTHKHTKGSQSGSSCLCVYLIAIRDRSRFCSGFRVESNVHKQTDGSTVHQRLSRPVSNETFHSRGLQFNPLKGMMPYSCTRAVNPLTRFCMSMRCRICFVALHHRALYPNYAYIS